MQLTKDHKVADLLRRIDRNLERIAADIAEIKASGHPRAEEIVDLLCDAGDLTVTPGALKLAAPLLSENALKEPASRFDTPEIEGEHYEQ